MDRRIFVSAVVSMACALVAPIASFAQPRKLWHIGALNNRPGRGAQDDAFLAGMRDLGYVEGQDFAIEYRWGAGHEDRLPGLVAELVALKMDVILAGGAQAIQAAKAASSTIPIVMAAVNDPVARGLVASLAHPGSTVTGLTLVSEDSAGKRLQLLKDVVPRASRVAVRISPLGDPVREALTKAAKPLSVQLQFVITPELTFAANRVVVAISGATRTDRPRPRLPCHYDARR